MPSINKIITQIKYATLMAESEEEPKSLLVKVKEENEKKKWLKSQHSENWSSHFMANG